MNNVANTRPVATLSSVPAGAKLISGRTAQPRQGHGNERRIAHDVPEAQRHVRRAEAAASARRSASYPESDGNDKCAQHYYRECETEDRGAT